MSNKILWVDPDRDKEDEPLMPWDEDQGNPTIIVHPAIRFKAEEPIKDVWFVYIDGSSHILNDKYEQHKGRVFGAYGLVAYEGLEPECIYEESKANEGWKTGKTELLGLYRALCWHCDYKYDSIVKIVSDALYVVNGYNSYLVGWVFNGWKKADGETIEHVELWKQIWEIKKNDFDMLINVCHTKGHQGDVRNEAVHNLALNTMREYRDQELGGFV